MSEEDVKEFENKACPTCGSCSGMYTANSMNCLTEVLGMGLKGNGTIPAVYSERIKLAKHAGMKVMELLERVSQTGITVLVVTHEHELVHRFHQRVVTLKNGRIISDIPADPEAIAARSAELDAWKELTGPVDDEPDEQNDETKEKEAATV